ncbi:MAG TPA: pitrilysin family protein [Candidatus Saccharimonadales bacterium]
MKHTVYELKLKNGAKGLLIDVPGATTLSAQVHFRAGNRYTASKDINETAHIMEHMAFGANDKFKSAHAFQEELSKNGAYFNASTYDVAMNYVVVCADFEWDRVLDMLELALTKPHFKQNEFEAESGNVRNELTGMLNRHGVILWPRLERAIGIDTVEFADSLATVANIQLKDIKAHYKRTHTLHNMRFVVAGALNEKRRAEIKHFFEKWDLPKGERLAYPRDTIHGAAPFFVRRKDAENIQFAWATSIQKELADDDYRAMDMLNHILTGTLYSRILGKARQQGLAYGMGSDIDFGRDMTSWQFSAEVNIDTVEPLFDIIVSEVKAVLNGKLRAEELDAAKQYALGRVQMRYQTADQVAGWYAGRYFYDDYVKDFSAIQKNINAVTKTHMIDIARRIMADKQWALGAIGKGDIKLVRRLADKLSVLY